MEKLIRSRSSGFIGVIDCRRPAIPGCPESAPRLGYETGTPQPAGLLFAVRSHLTILKWGQRFGHCILLLVLGFALAATASPRDDATVADLKARVSSASVPDRAHLCLQIAEKQLNETEKLYAGADLDKAQAPLTDVVAYSELARDYSIQSHKYQKQTEIAVREMTRKLNGILHTLGRDEQPPVKDALSRLERVRDDLLASMFKKGAK